MVPRFVLLMVACFALVTPAPADDEPAPSPDVVAEAVTAAFGEQDETRLAELAKRKDPDPWVVVAFLCVGRHFDAAEAFAKASRSLDTALLPAYVKARRGASGESGRPPLAALAAAHGIEDPEEALDALERLDPGEDAVARVFRDVARGERLAELERLAQARDAFAAAAERSLGVGWLSSASTALHAAGACAQQLEDFDGAQTHWERRLEVDQERGSGAGRLEGLGNLGLLLEAQLQLEPALARFQDAARLAKKLGRGGDEGRMLANAGHILFALDRADESLTANRRALELLRADGNVSGIAMALGGIATVLAKRGDHDGALALQAEALELHEQAKDTRAAARVLRAMGAVQRTKGDRSASMKSLDRALASERAHGNAQGEAETLMERGLTHFRFRHLADAAKAYRAAAGIFERIGARHELAVCRAGLGGTLHSQKLVQEALDEYDRAAALFEALGRRAALADVTTNAGLALLDLEKVGAARDRFAVALKLLRSLEDKRGTAVVLDHLAYAHALLGDDDKAAAAWVWAYGLRERLGDRDGLIETAGRLERIYRRLGDEERESYFAKKRKALEAERDAEF